VRQLLQIEARPYFCVLEQRRPRGGAILSLGVQTRHPRLESGKLTSLGRVARRRNRLRDRQEIELSSHIRRQGRNDWRESLRLLDDLPQVSGRLLLALRGQGVGVVGHEVFIDPIGAIPSFPKHAQAPLDLGHERGRGLRARRVSHARILGVNREMRRDRRGSSSGRGTTAAAAPENGRQAKARNRWKPGSNGHGSALRSATRSLPRRATTR
jgi:hypothetical protein